MKKVRYTVSILGIVTLLGICVSNNVFAAGWIGTGGNQPSGVALRRKILIRRTVQVSRGFILSILAGAL